MSGWVKLHRTLLDWQWIGSPNHFTLFGHLLLRANYKTSEWREHKILRGQLLTGRKQLSMWSGLSEMQIRRVLQDFVKSREIAIKTTKSFSIISVLNYELYQDDNQQVTNEQPTSNQAVTNEQPHPKKVIREEGKKERINTNKGPSPLAVLFPNDEQICEWLLTGNFKVQARLLQDHSHHVLVEEIVKAYLWQLAKQKRKSDTFLVTWMGNKNTQAFSPNQAKAGFKSKSNGLTPTPENPTGNPYIQQARDEGLIA